MRRLLQARLLAAAVGLLASAAVGASVAGPAAAHGSTQRPPSRYYSCRFENPANPMCAAAWSANAQALYDWMEVNVGDADGHHQELIPDGRLCSANRSKYAAFDAPGNWPVANLQPNGSGLVDIVYTSTAPHATAYYRFYLTRDGFDARSDSLSWGDLELMYDSGPLAASPEPRFQVPLPTRSTPAILYVIWQRNDSSEAFYACSDVTVGATSVPAAAGPPVTAAGGPTTVASPVTVTVASPALPPAAVGRTPAAPPTPATSAPSPAVSATVSPAVELAQAPSATAESPPAVTEPSAATAPPAMAAPSAVVSATSVPEVSATAAAPDGAVAAEPSGSSSALLWTVTAILTVAGLVGLTCLLAPPVRPVPAWIRAQRPDRRHRRARTIG